MSVICCKAYGDYEEEYTDDGWKVTRKYSIRNAIAHDGLTTEDVAVAALMAQVYGVPGTTDPIDLPPTGLFLSSYRLKKLDSVSGVSYQAEVSYSSQKVKALIGSVISIRGATERVKRFYAPVIAVAGLASEAVLNGAVNVDEHGAPQGMDVVIPKSEMTIQVRLPANSVTLTNLVAWDGLQTKVNSLQWGAFGPGQAQFLEYSFSSGDGQKDQVEMHFSIAPTETFVLLSTTLTKLGHDYLSIGWRKYYSAGDKFIGARIEYAAIHRPYTYTDFTHAFQYSTGLDLIDVAMVANL